MSYVLDAGNENSKIIHITSSDATNKLGEGFLEYVLDQSIITPASQDTLISLYSAIIPYSFYNVREGINDKIYYSQVGSSIQLSITIPKGSYTINSLETKLEELLSAVITGDCSITFSRTTMKFTYNIPQHLGANQIYFNFEGKTDGAEVSIGFPPEYTGLSTGFTSLESVNVPDVNGGVHSVNIRSNLTTKGCIDSQSNGFSTILATMPIDVNFGGVLFHRPADAIHKIIIQQKEIKRLIVRLTDDRDRLLDLNGLDFNITILIDHIKHGRDMRRRIPETQQKIELPKKVGRPRKEKTKIDIPMPLIN